MEFIESPSGLTAHIELSGLSREVELAIKRSDDTATEQHQHSALKEFVVAWPALFEKLKRPLFSYYVAVRDGATQSGPIITGLAEVWSFVDITRIVAPSICSGTHRFVQLFGNCSWEEEHGLEVCVRNGATVIYVGAFNGNSFSGYYAGKPWNYAHDA